MDPASLRERAARHGQEQLFAFWQELNGEQQAALAADVEQVDFDLVSRLIETHVSADAGSQPASVPEAPDTLPANSTGPEMRRRFEAARRQGESLIAEGHVAALVVAGGQGTRLGFDGPKGLYPASPIRNKPLFALFAESLLATGRRYGRAVPWYIMTSPGNDAATRAHFAELDYFGLDPRDVVFFQQGVMPAVDQQGRILLAEKHRLALSPDGHGGTLRALEATGALADMATRGVEIISYFQVDNPLVRPVDPLFVGLHAESGSQMSSLVIGKADDFERVGVFGVVNGCLNVIEYSDLPDELATARNPDGSRRFDAANIAVHALSRPFVTNLTSSEAGPSLPWHRAMKKVAYVDPATGRKIEPVEPNGIKFETFIFDALPLAEKPLLLQSRRGEVFSPIKNAEGVDSAVTARRDLVRRAADWLEHCGVSVPRMPEGEPDCTIEISPLLGLDADDLARNLKVRPVIDRGAEVYLDG